MKVLASLLALTGVASAHYNFDALIYNGQQLGQWEHVRMRQDKDSHGPVTDVSSQSLRCGLNAPAAPSVLNVAAGSTIGFRAEPSVQHPGPTTFYLAKVPSGQTAKTFDGSGAVWFKIFEQGATFSGGKITWESDGKLSLSATIPKNTPSGEYLLRIEHIGLHSAAQVGGAQFYLSCAQINVTGGGSGNPSPKVAIPGAYNAQHPGVLFQLYWPVPTSYTVPGPAVWSG